MAELFGVDVGEMKEGYVALEAYVLIEALDVNGRTVLLTRASKGLTNWRSLGMLETASALERNTLINCFDPEEP